MELGLELSVLFDYYGVLLTDMQQAICDLYYNQNLSLAEIAEEVGITKQGVRDALKKAEKHLFHYEEALNIKQKNDKLSQLVTELQKLNINEDQKAQMICLTEQINDLI